MRLPGNETCHRPPRGAWWKRELYLVKTRRLTKLLPQHLETGPFPILITLHNQVSHKCSQMNVVKFERLQLRSKCYRTIVILLSWLDPEGVILPWTKYSPNLRRHFCAIMKSILYIPTQHIPTRCHALCRVSVLKLSYSPNHSNPHLGSQPKLAPDRAVRMMGRPENHLVKLLAMLEILPMRTASINSTASINRNTVKVLSGTDHKCHNYP